MLKICWLIASVFCLSAVAQETPSGPPGLMLSFESADGKTIDARESRLLAISVPAGAQPTPFVPAGQFHATFRGFVNLKIRDQYSFTAHGRGEFELLVNGQSVLKCSGEDLASKSSELVKLKKGPNELVAHYTAPASGDAVLRVSWAMKNSPADPVPPIVLTHADDQALTPHLPLRQGRELLATMRCVRCHAVPESVTTGEGAMPELVMDAPNLDDAGARLNPQWIARWILDPKAVRADATMPKVFAKAQAAEASEKAARDIAAYLATCKTAAAPTGDVHLSDANVIAGMRLFTNLGCIACHSAPAGQDDPTRTSLRHVRAKYQPAGLKGYLKQPEAHYAWTRMPNFALSDEEATNLAAFLLKSAPENPLPGIDLKGADAERGKMFFELTGCVRCHAPNQKSTTRAKPMAQIAANEWSKGCLASDADARGNAPDYAMNDAQRTAIQAFAKTDLSSVSHEALPEFAERSIRSLNCTACHPRDAELDRWSKLSPEITAIQKDLPPEKPPGTDQLRPVLTWVGEKLHPEWMGKFIGGKVEYKPRPWLVARMPSFPARAEAIAKGLCLEHGMTFTDPPEPPVDQGMVDIGRKLVGRAGGFSCNQCHAINQSPAFVPFDSPSPNFMHVTERLRKDFYQRWVHGPMKYQPGTKMPSFIDGEGKTAYKNILGGDANKQFEAIWQYLRAGKDIVPPE